jgi:aminoglycoside phosphotransferase (APT) family kinase protein
MAAQPPALDDDDGLLNWPHLQEWIATRDLPGEGPVTGYRKLAGGSQNHIYRMQREGGEFVLRRPPEHLRANSNETMLREARVLAALAGTAVPHPAYYDVCDDLDVIGVAFYCMAAVEGFAPTTGLEGRYLTDPAWREQLGLEMAAGAARLAAVDHDAVGLASFGKADNWLERQVSRWRSQLEGYAQLPGYGKPEIPGVDAVGEWLDANRPAGCRIGIIHGDYQFANVLFARDEPKLAAIVDWELSTLGDPLLDLAWALQALSEPGDVPGRSSQIKPGDGVPTRARLAAHYGELTGRDMSVLPWYQVLAYYKLGILLEGTYARSCAGQATAELGAVMHDYTLWLFAMALRAMA